MSNKNLIYFGPAGTGKTTEALNKAVEIVNSVSATQKTYNELCKKPELPFKHSKDTESLYDDIENYEKSPSEILEVKKYIGYFKEEENSINLIKDYRAYPLIEMITFHPSYSYQDFIEGIFPEVGANNSVKYSVKDGIFKKTCLRAKENPDKNYVLIIDEINRGNISSIFGEAFTLIENDKREGAKGLEVNLPYSKNEKGLPKKFSVPSNLYIVATMNTVDKSIALLDVALRRRFDFIEVKTNYDILKNIECSSIELDKLLKAINIRIMCLKNEHYEIGHSEFLPNDFDIESENNVLEFDRFKTIIIHRIIPLLQEYFYDDWRSICAVLNQSYNNPSLNGLLKEKMNLVNYFNEEYNDFFISDENKIFEINLNFSEENIKMIY